MKKIFGNAPAGISLRRNKYHATTVETKYGKFDSRHEYERFLILSDMEERGEIFDLHRQVPFTLIESQRENGKVIERPVVYYADFVYFKEPYKELVVEDAKGLKTEVYKIKRKLMLKVHGIRIKEV